MADLVKGRYLVGYSRSSLFIELVYITSDIRKPKDTALIRFIERLPGVSKRVPEIGVIDEDARLYSVS